MGGEIEGLGGDEVLARLFLTPEGIADPAPLYRHLRETAPQHRSALGPLWLSRFDDGDRVLRDARFGKGTMEGDGLVPEGDSEAARFRGDQRRRMRDAGRVASMLFLDPPRHTRQRRLVSRAFTPRRVEELRSSVRSLAEGAVDSLAEAGGGDLLEVVGFPLPVAVIGTMVGVPEADWASFRPLVTAATAGLEPGSTLAELEAAEVAGAEVAGYFVDLVGERRRRPGADMLSDLIAVDDGGDRLSTGEIVAVAMLLFSAGFETTTNLIGNAAAALLAHPDQRARLWADPALGPGAVEEVLRWDSPVQLDVRRALEPADVAGTPVGEGVPVVILIGAANRDPARYPDPDRFDITRGGAAPLSFAAGIHHCLGAPLARAEGQEVLAAMVARFARVDLAGELVRRPRTTLRGWQAVPVTVQPR